MTAAAAPLQSCHSEACGSHGSCWLRTCSWPQLQSLQPPAHEISYITTHLYTPGLELRQLHPSILLTYGVAQKSALKIMAHQKLAAQGRCMWLHAQQQACMHKQSAGKGAYFGLLELALCMLPAYEL